MIFFLRGGEAPKCIRVWGRYLCETDDRVNGLGGVPGMTFFVWFSLKNAKNVRMRMAISSRCVSVCVSVGYSGVEPFFSQIQK